MNDNNTVTVTTDLRNEHEIVMHAQFLGALLQSRGGATSVGPVTNTPGAPVKTPAAPQLVPKPATAVADISPDSVERKFRDFIHRHSTAEARTLLDKYDAPFLKDVAPDRLGAFVEEISR